MHKSTKWLRFAFLFVFRVLRSPDGSLCAIEMIEMHNLSISIINFEIDSKLDQGDLRKFMKKPRATDNKNYALESFESFEFHPVISSPHLLS